MDNNRDEYQIRRIRTALPSTNLTEHRTTLLIERASSSQSNLNNSSERTSKRPEDRDADFSNIYHSSIYIPTSEDNDLSLSSHRKREAHNENPPYQRFSENSSRLTDLTRQYSQTPAHYSSHQEVTTNHLISRSTDQFYRNSNRMENPATNDTHQFGLIILGNAGVGKSFLGNILLSRDVFVHKFSVGSVTHDTEYSEIQVGGFTFAIFNIPGLIEANQKRIDLNKREIEKAFLARPNSIVLYVFGNQRGRLRDEDMVAFNAINAAYSFRRESLVLVMNDLDKDRPSDYEGTTLVLLQQLLPHVEINEQNVCFLNRIAQNNRNEKQFLKEQLLTV